MLTILKNNQTERDQIMCQTLIMFCAHIRNVVNNLKESQMRSISDFNWLKEMRFYFTENKINISIFNCFVEYGFEYIGNQPKLVMTTLTDRCYQSIFFALKNKFACALTVYLAIFPFFLFYLFCCYVHTLFSII